MDHYELENFHVDFCILKDKDVEPNKTYILFEN